MNRIYANKMGAHYCHSITRTRAGSCICLERTKAALLPGS